MADLFSGTSAQITPFNFGAGQIRQIDGVYSLNDLHAASGGQVRHQPTRFMRLDQTQALIAELSDSPEMVNGVFKIVKGSVNPGTYACRELVIAYAAWISASFHLKVIRFFLTQAAPSLAEPTPSLRNRRWLVSFDDQGCEVIQPVPCNALVLPLADFVRGLTLDGDIGTCLTNVQLAEIAQGCAERLKNRLSTNINVSARKMVTA